jgi:hypothetical protein
MKIKTITLLSLNIIAGILFNPAGATRLSAQTDSSANDSVIEALTEKVNSLKSGESHFMVAGLTTIGWVSSQTTLNSARIPGVTNSFSDIDHFEFSPMLLWRHDDNVLLEFEPSFNNNSIGVNWADVHYFILPGLALRAGYFVLPFGIYQKKLAAGWINPLATDPIGIGSPPQSDWGVGASGGIHLGTTELNYDVSLTNGYHLNNDGTIASADGAYGMVDNNNGKTVTGRIGFLPLSNSSLEIGVSCLSGKVGDINTPFQNAGAFMYAFDINYLIDISPFNINIKGQYNSINISKEYYVLPSDTAQTYTFNNKATSYFGQISIRPGLMESVFLSKLEIVFRYAAFNTPENSMWGQNAYQLDIGLDYWLSFRSVLKFTYETINSTNTSLGNGGDKTNTNSIYIQYSTEL